MYRTLASILLFGMVPGFSTPLEAPVASIGAIDIAPPAEELRIADSLSASGVVVIDVPSGQMVYEKASRFERPMASLTKLMTALIIVENHNLDEWVTVPIESTEVVGNRVYLEAGQRFSVEDMLSALLIASANDAAHALALFHSGSQAAFVEEMNERALALGLTDTKFANPSGLDGFQHWSTPRDIAWLTMFSLSKPAVEQRMGRRSDRIWSSNGTSIDLYHTHALLHANADVQAGKTGTTPAAKECLVTLVEKDDHPYLIVIMHSAERYKDLSLLLDSLDPESALLSAR